MGILNNGRCCGRNLVFDLTSGLIPTQDCPPICLTVSKFSNLPDPATDCEFALVSSVSEIGVSLQLVQWDGVQWVQMTGFGATPSDYSYNVFDITLNAGWTAIVNGITYDTSDTYNIDPTYYLDITFVSPQGCQYAMDRIGFDPLTSGGINFQISDGYLPSIPFDYNDLSAWNTYLGSDFQALVVFNIGSGETFFYLYGSSGNLSIANSLFSGWAIINVVSENGNYSDFTSIGDGAFSGCTALTNINLQWAETIGDGCFNGCTVLQAIILPRCTQLGSTAGDNGVFNGITGNTITAEFNIALQTNNGGNVDGDIQYLIDNNTVTITWVNP